MHWSLTQADARLVLVSIRNRLSDLVTLEKNHPAHAIVPTLAGLADGLTHRLEAPDVVECRSEAEVLRLRRAFHALNSGIEEVWPVLSDFTRGKLTTARAEALAILNEPVLTKPDDTPLPDGMNVDARGEKPRDARPIPSRPEDA